MVRVAVIGSGYVGLVAAACFAELGHEVICVDNDARKIAALERGETPIHEKFLPELLARHRGTALRFSGSIEDATRVSQAIFIAVGTPPSENGEADLSYVEAVSREIANAIAAHPDHYRIVVEKSTVPVDTSQGVRRVMELHGAPTELFDVASNPEFLREGTAVTDFLYPDRIVIGANSDRCIALLRQIYQPLTDGSYYNKKTIIPEPDDVHIPARLIATSAKSAELIKHASNAFLAMKISFINAVAAVCESVGADIGQVREGVGSDARIGNRFLNAGIGYGGSCFPKDVKAFRAVAEHCGYDFRLLDEVMKINEEQRQRFIKKVRSALWILKGKRLAVLGLAFKGGTDDIRDSQAIAIIELLLKEGCSIAAYDPAAMPKTQASGIFPQDKLFFAENSYTAAKDADAVLVLTDWEEFAALDLERLRAALKHPIMIDGRNLFRPEKMAELGFQYVSVGRPEVAAKKSAAISTPSGS
jgi:UDPglucose 6-dehydrogenase